MIGDLFDSPWKILIVAIVIIVLFGSAKLPAAARSLGRSMRILKSEVSSMHDDEDETQSQSPSAVQPQLAAAAPPPVAPVTPAQPGTDEGWSATTQQVAGQAAHQARIDSLEQQLRELKESADKKAAVPADQQPR
ncbi:MAG TPA: Sec-independent protein translocase subunit TatA [Streptosporangiaceae bacterium]|jgi:sec-independent protein translocase protein TatA|nr:Sec-independent protein translocase subunit TatA [Streptosporangiaceae bacterium]